MKLPVETIEYKAGTQPRYYIGDEDVVQYQEDMERGAKFPPIVVFTDGKTHWLADGFHRLFAEMNLGHKTINCDVKKGTLRDAILYACSANATHGLPRTNDDKRQAVETLLHDAEWSKWSDSAIAKHCHVSDRFVGKVRTSLRTVQSENRPAVSKSSTTRRYTTKHGTEATMDTTNIGGKPKRGKPEPQEKEDGDLPDVRRLKDAWNHATENGRNIFWDWLQTQ